MPIKGEKTNTMKLNNLQTLSTSPLTQPAKNPRSFASLSLQRRSFYGRKPRCYTGKEQDSETGLHYYGARYLDSRTGRWLSGDPAVSEYIPSAPVNEESRKRNGNLPGMGGVFNYVNLHVYHYAGNNPVRYTDPDGLADWDMAAKGALNLFKGIGKIKLGVGVYGVSGAGAVVSGGSATFLACLGFIAATGLVANGWYQASVGAAELVAGLVAQDPIPPDVQNAIPDTLNQVLATTFDSIVSSATDEPSTVMQDMVQVVDTIQDEAGTKGTERVFSFFLTPSQNIE